MNLCKHYVNNKCTRTDCKFKHVDNICRNYFFNECNNKNCKYSHEYKLNSNGSNVSNGSNNKQNTIVKNTESFVPDHSEPSIRILFNEPLSAGNEVCIINNMFINDNIYSNLLSEISNDVYKPWHGDSHLIADDSHDIDWKSISPTFDFIIKQLCSYFCMTVGATRLNYYVDETDWKPYHHDAAALKPNKAKTQNITVGASFGITREISFESTHSHTKERIRINFPLKDTYVYAFGNKVNIDFKHGIPQISESNKNISNNKITKEKDTGRISIIIWGYSSLL